MERKGVKLNELLSTLRQDLIFKWIHLVLWPFLVWLVTKACIKAGDIANLIKLSCQNLRLTRYNFSGSTQNHNLKFLFLTQRWRTATGIQSVSTLTLKDIDDKLYKTLESTSKTPFQPVHYQLHTKRPGIPAFVSAADKNPQWHFTWQLNASNKALQRSVSSTTSENGIKIRSWLVIVVESCVKSAVMGTRSVFNLIKLLNYLRTEKSFAQLAVAQKVKLKSVKRCPFALACMKRPV